MGSDTQAAVAADLALLASVLAGDVDSRRRRFEITSRRSER